MQAAALNLPAASQGHSSLKGTRSGQSYKLGGEIGRGGNGVVYTVSRRPDLVAKIQKSPYDAQGVAKLERMMQGATVELLSVSAWPVDGLRDDAGRVVGFIMPRIFDARPIYELYSPRSRVQHFPTADFRFLVHAAGNVARLFHAIHQAGFVAGDVNHSNVMVRQNGTAAVIDCDSMQVGNGQQFRCEVATELFVPPELMGADLRSTQRTPNHDNFGLAILLFQLLFMGRHPFAGVFHGRGEMPIERALAEARYAYSEDGRRTQMSPPPMTVPVPVVGREMARLFEAAFHPSGRAGTRPRPEEWCAALDRLKANLVPCDEVAWHHHPAGLKCPWCALENGSRLKLFGGVLKALTAGVADLETLWARYEALTSPAAFQRPPRPVLKVARPRLPQLAVRNVHHQNGPPRVIRLPALLADIGGRVRWTNIALLLYCTYMLYDLGALNGMDPLVAQVQEFWHWIAKRPLPEQTALATGVLLGLTMLEAPVSRLSRTLIIAPPRPPTAWTNSRSVRVPAAPKPSHGPKQSLLASLLAWRRAVVQWKNLPEPPDVSDLREPIHKLKAELDALAAEREARMKRCALPLPEDEQLQRHLAQFRIEDAKLPSIGAARCAVLRSWGVDTAADIEEARIAEIPGFGRGLTEKLIRWREHQEREFQPNTAAVVDPLDVQKIDRELAHRRTKLMKELRGNVLALERRLDSFIAARNAYMNALGKP